MNIKHTLENILNSVLEKHPHIFVVEVSQNDNLYEIILDGDQGLGIYDISSVSRELNHLADEQMPEEQYSLDVATPGADSPLKLFRQYPKHINRELQVECSVEPFEFKGQLVAAENNVLTFEYFQNAKPKKNEAKLNISLPFETIKKAQIILSFK